MSAMGRGLATVSVMAGLSLAMLAGCGDAGPMTGGMAKSPVDAAGYPSPSTASVVEAEAPRAPSASRDYRAEEPPPADEAPRKDRPGLGTEWGETRYSSISHVSFERADFASPFAALALFYNDQAGANAMTSARQSFTNGFTVAGGLVSVELRDEAGRPYHGFTSAGRSYAVGEAGHRYSIVLHNRTSSRFEVVLSVDGLDVMDGKSASFDKRGYILDAHGDIEVDGFRQSTDTVAAFRFGAVRNSYAQQKHGDARNVGVIGVALFHERGEAQPVWTPDEVRKRRSANPFPGTFATPPGE
ncbi:Putative outer membrane lipoprotein [Minicystis rosea]|nr:Putative outer membrane lipoprotein [Minicystis rosea]